MADDLARVYFPFQHNWASSYVARWEYLTNIITSDAGVEQRIAFRSTPRRTITTSVQPAMRDFQKFQRLVAAAQNIPVVIPDMTRSTVLVGDAAAGATVVQFAISPWLYAGQELIIGEGSDGFVTKIAGFSGNNTTLSVAIPAFAAGTVVRPALTAYWPQQLSASMVTDLIAQATIEFAVDPLKELVPATAPGATFNGREVFAFENNWRKPLDVKWQWPLQIVDFERGPMTPYRQIDFPTSVSAAEYLFDSALGADAFVDFFKRMRGRRTAFYKANETADMTLVAPVASGATLLFVEGAELAIDFDQHSVFNAIQIDLNDGSTLCHNVTNIVISFGNSRLTLDPPLARDITANDVRKISWLVYSRFATDGIEMSFVTDQIATSAIAIQSLPKPSDNFAALRSTLEGADRETVPGDDRVVFTF